MTKELFTGFSNTLPLWEKKQFEIQQFEFPSLVLASFQPKPIPTNLRLGHQMEHVFKQLVEDSEVYRVVLYNLPIKNEERTLGEIDFILKDQTTGKFIHVELTYKFYLIDPDISEPVHSLIGPNRRDTFFAKMEKIKNKQFPLIHSEEGAKALHEHHIDHLTMEHQCCFKAQLFQPYGKEVPIGTLNKDCLAGHWLRFDDFNTPEFAKAQFYMPTKSEWVIEPQDQVAWKSHVEILIDLDQSLLQERAPMLWIKSPTGEFQKVFVVWW